MPKTSLTVRHCCCSYCESGKNVFSNLVDEIARLKGEKGKPKIKPSRLEAKEKALNEQPNSQDNPSSEENEEKKRPGSEKRRKTAQLTIHETKVIPPAEEIPPGSE